MSRLMIKNVPAYVTPERLRAHFSQSSGPGGTITDVKVAMKRDGTSRRFGFVGYKADEEAQAAKEWFDRTFIDTMRINVAVIEGAKGAPAPRPNKRPRPVTSSPAGISSDKDTSRTEAEPIPEKKDAQLAEFMEIMQPRSKKGPSWTNERDSGPTTTARPPSSTKEKPDPKGNSEEQPALTANAPENDISDLDWMKRHMTATLDSASNELEGNTVLFEQSDSETEEQPHENPVADVSDAADDATKTILSTARLFVRNLAFSCLDDDLQNLFSPFGDVKQVHIPLDHQTKQPKGIAYITFVQPTCALAAYEALDKRSFQGRLLHILPAVDRKGNVQVEKEGDGKKSVKTEKHLNRKADAGKGFNWGMLFMNSDAVLSSIADRMKISKADILDPESTNAAVKVALAETHVINETKEYLKSQGIILSSFASRTRSSTTILVKNIPYGTTATQIRELFEQHGELSRVVVPPAGTIAVVEFVHAVDAKGAFRAVAYRRLGSSIIYLEMGPSGMIAVSKPDESSPMDGPQVIEGVAPVAIAQPDGDQDGEQVVSVSGGSTLFVKNLSFSTTTERLTQAVRGLGGFVFARVQTKPDPKRPEAGASRLSMGYGFVGFKTVDDAKKALKGLNGHVLDGHALHVKFAGRGREDEEESKLKETAKSRTTKMIVKNVPFEATKKDIRDLFGAHGQLRAVRLPKKFDSRSRGFAFLDFVTRREAENAYAALRHTHLLGRHLVLEWASEAEQDLDLLRLKAGVGFGGGTELPGRKRKLELDLDEGGGEQGDS